MKLKKNYHTADIQKLWLDGAIIKRDYSLDTYGTSPMGYMERRGIRINGKKYQVVYSARGYGRITSEIKFYNGRFLEKHKKYMDAVRDHFYNNILPYINYITLYYT